MGLEATGEHSVELVGDFHAQGEELVVEVGRIVEIELMATGCVPQDETFGVHEIEMDDGEAIIRIDPYSQEWFSGRAFGADRWRGELNLLIDHALNGDLTSGPASKGWDDDESVRADGNVAVAGRLGSRSGLGLALEDSKRLLPQLMELSLKEAQRVGIGQLQQAQIGRASCRERVFALV